MDSNTDTYQDPRTIADLGGFVDSLVGSAKGALRSEREHITFTLAKRSAEATAKVIGSVASFVLFGLMVVIASMGAAIWAGREMGDLVYGFGAVAGFYGLLGIVFSAMWKGSTGKNFIVGLINTFYGH